MSENNECDIIIPHSFPICNSQVLACHFTALREGFTGLQDIVATEMNAELEKRKTKIFIGCLVAIALFINLQYAGRGRAPLYIETQSPSPQKSEAVSRAIPEPAVKAPNVPRRGNEPETTKGHSELIARYLISGDYTRNAGVKVIAIAAVTEDGRFNRTLSSALTGRLKGTSVRILTSLFTQEFVSDGLWNDIWNGRNQILSQLELRHFVDGLVFARQKVDYSTNPELADTVTANMAIEVMTVPISSPDDITVASFSAAGVGFKKNEARRMAEERILVQLDKDFKIPLEAIARPSLSK